ncbi:uncharacterized protein TRIVIDRAFT_224553 [Trichoderma virens Gv29-8]|uniref:Uncharacterized protein n=1 Tax=Hypocrea virens (strain Gv29-8 / FGSC 10586) TaxID=413071 RepID=G9N0L7_HYPVG|nr:uncharacterized protein TRIVIDRAFT_224553 [Trichoderma virens Gv29-8]EHK19899.1 hypothetical protein TRIVIDRAFT_224553 [Trichoderma virens Gv29-8]UKZ53271.1 hypothetical protein TrVGV298_007063 [Trichoderma virens]UKZ79045.1 hypothetical protein TrVFT333_006796 [Trichoderma virens FT-333]
MDKSSTRACNGSVVGNEVADTTPSSGGPQTADGHDPSYSVNRFLLDTENHPPGHGPARDAAQALQKIRDFEAKFNSSSDAPRGS